MINIMSRDAITVNASGISTKNVLHLMSLFVQTVVQIIEHLNMKPSSIVVQIVLKLDYLQMNVNIKHLILVVQPFGKPKTNSEII